jgi:hypothetical protein
MDHTNHLQVFALNDHHHADNPEVSAEAVAVRWAKQLGGRAHWTLTEKRREFDSPELVVLGAGGKAVGHIAKNYHLANVIGDVGYLPITAGGEEVHVANVEQHLTGKVLRDWAQLDDKPVFLVIPHSTNERADVARFVCKNRWVNHACISKAMAEALK